jgi:hypothetical protein
MADCLVPANLQEPATNLDLLQYAISLKAALESCNQDKRGLREFYGAPGGAPKTGIFADN